MSEYSFNCEPLTPHLGAEITGLNLADLSDAQFGELEHAFARYAVLVFRDQALSREQHKAFGARFGELHVHPSHALRKNSDKNSEEVHIFKVKATPTTEFANGEAWHTDMSAESLPPKISILYVRELPGESGGDTLFANMYMAFETLSPALQAWLRTLNAYHDGMKDLAAYNVQLAPGQTYPNATHPVVIRHPVTDREVLFVNRSFTERIEELTRAESDALLEMLWHHVENNPRFHCRVRWRPNTITMWDNRCTWHHAVWDYFPHTRYGERVSVNADARPAR